MRPTRLELVVSRAGAGESGPFGALLVEAERDVAAAEGLSLAYASMSREDRARMVSAIVEDGGAAGRSPAGPLALLLAVEEDRELAGIIAAGLDGSLARRGLDAGHRWGDEGAGGVALVRHLHGGFVELLRVAWGEAEIEVEAEPLARHDEEGLLDRHGVPSDAERVGLSRAIDELAQALWRRRQRGRELPPRLRAFAHFFALDAASHPPVDGRESDGVE